MNTISFRLKSEMKFQTVELDSTFVSIGELRRLICEQLALDQAKETVELWDHGANRARYSDDNKMISKGQKVMVARIPALQRRAIGNAAGEPAATPDAPAPEPAATDEFGGDVFNEQEQMKRLVEERSKDWGKDLATGAKAARFRRFQEEAAAATREGGGDEGAYKRKHTIHARGIPSSFLPRATVAKPADVDPSGVNAIKLLDGTVATLAGGELQAAEDAAIAAKQAAENAARAKPTLAPLAPLAFDDFALSAAPVDPMALVRAHFLPSAPVAEPLQLEAPRPATPALELTLAASAAPPSAQPRVPLPPDYSILNTCRAFLPHADHPEHLLKAFAIPTPLSRAEWNAFRALLPRSRRASPPRHRRRYSPSPERRRAASPLRRDLRTARGGDLRRGYVPERRDDDADERARRARRARLRSRSAERSEAETDARRHRSSGAGVRDSRSASHERSNARRVDGGRRLSDENADEDNNTARGRSASAGPSRRRDESPLPSRRSSRSPSPRRERRSRERKEKRGKEKRSRERDRRERKHRHEKRRDRDADSAGEGDGDRAHASAEPEALGSPHERKKARRNVFAHAMGELNGYDERRA